MWTDGVGEVAGRRNICLWDANDANRVLWMPGGAPRRQGCSQHGRPRCVQKDRARGPARRGRSAPTQAVDGFPHDDRRTEALGGLRARSGMGPGQKTDARREKGGLPFGGGRWASRQVKRFIALRRDMMRRKHVCRGWTGWRCRLEADLQWVRWLQLHLRLHLRLHSRAVSSTHAGPRVEGRGSRVEGRDCLLKPRPWCRRG
ncbi:hypothetical protein BS50DRAFT_33086 [Corynespora cassiicola Philippines]|uniref:Uncharacterized protein n=1 Tax=Corynespora cassiicola Philippines TaxID=1448308 RepID=A0A2T2PBS4_CORCC|nr:hypothetical protein BS50DRAFT_33086 [Corynespora cassiicola Philippines]